MGLETPAYVPDLVLSNPANSDQRKQGDDHLRALKTATQQSLALFGGGLTTGGTSTALTVTTGHVNGPTYKDGHLYAFGLHTDIGVDATINFDALGARTIKYMTPSGWSNVQPAQFKSGHVLLCYYEGGDSTMRVLASYVNADAFMDSLTVSSTDAGAGAAPNLLLYRNSATPANSDFGGLLSFDMNSSTGVRRQMFRMFPQVTDTTNASEDADVFFQHKVAGVDTTRVQFVSTGVNVAGTLLSTGAMFPGGDTNFNLTLSAGNPIITFDTNDTLAYDRTNNSFNFGIGASTIGVVNASRGMFAFNTPVAAVSYQFPAGVPTADRAVNVSSLTDNATGDVTVNVTIAVANAELTSGMSGAVLGANVHSTYRNLNRSQTTTALQLISLDFLGAAVDAVRASAIWVNGA